VYPNKINSVKTFESNYNPISYLKSTGESLGKITLSFGVANYKKGEVAEDFVNRADEALYQSKKHRQEQSDRSLMTAAFSKLLPGDPYC
jgi:PleD family two-component response regulator